MVGHRVLRIGHRGASAQAPENTLASFRRAIELGADGVELDLHRTKDGRFIVIHDDTLERTTDGSGPVDALSLEELRRLDAGSWKGREFAGERIPMLEEVIDALPATATVFAELKAGSDRAPGIEEDLARWLAARSAVDRVRISSFDHRALARLRRLVPALRTAALFVCLPVDPVGLARACGAQAIHPSFRYLTRDVVDEAHRGALEVHTWTVNEPADIAAVRALGVDGIMSDYPERLAASAP
jgi:glycerophosphoryl diester phosphodiesterase